MSSRIAKRAKFWPKLAIFKGRGSKNRFIGISRSKFFIGGGRLYREDHFELSYASLPQCIWTGSPNEPNDQKGHKWQNLAKTGHFNGRGSKNRFIGMSRSNFFIWGGRPYREEHFELLYAPLALTCPVGSQNEQNFGQNWPFLKGGGLKIDL